MKIVPFKWLPAALFVLALQGCSNASDRWYTAPSHSQQDAVSKSPLPYAESMLPSRVATHFKTVSTGDTLLEGASFDRAGRLVFSDVKGQKLLRMSPDGQLTTLASFSQGHPGGTAIHQNGQIYVAVISDHYTRGSIVSVSPDSGTQRTIIGPEKGFVPNDLVFDEKGGFYFTDFRGDSTNPAGGVYYASPEARTITPIILHISQANGVALSPNGKTLWVTEYGTNLLHRIRLESATTLAVLGTSVPYRFTGAGPDSMRVDREGNIYVAMMEQGRVLVFAPNGVAVGQILLPQRDTGHNLLSASLALSPDSNDMYVVAGNTEDERGASIFHSLSQARGVKLFSHN